MSELFARLRSSEFLRHMTNEQVKTMASAPVRDGLPGAKVQLETSEHFVLLEGRVDLARRIDSVHVASFAAGAEDPAVALIYAVTPDYVIRIVRPCRYLILDDVPPDGHVASPTTDRDPSAQGAKGLPADVRKRAERLRQKSPFDELTEVEALACAGAMEALTVPAGSDIVRHGQPGRFLYVLEDGQADVWRSGPRYGATVVRVATLGPGATFGEEALLQDGPRNATVRARVESRVLRLEKPYFDRYISSRLVDEIDGLEAQRRMALGNTVLIDCRHDMEHRFAHIPGGRLIPLDAIRERAAELDRLKSYIVYCRSGSQSRAAAYLMRKAGLRVVALRGGIAAWPAAVEGKIGGRLDARFAQPAEI